MLFLFFRFCPSLHFSYYKNQENSILRNSNKTLMGVHPNTSKSKGLLKKHEFSVTNNNKLKITSKKRTDPARKWWKHEQKQHFLANLCISVAYLPKRYNFFLFFSHFFWEILQGKGPLSKSRDGRGRCLNFWFLEEKKNCRKLKNILIFLIKENWNEKEKSDIWGKSHVEEFMQKSVCNFENLVNLVKGFK